MATNPMQRKANNYLLMGILGTLLVTGVIIAILFMQLNKAQQDIKKRDADLNKAYVVAQDIKSGEQITDDKLKIAEVSSSVIPGNKVDMAFLTDESKIYTAKIDLKVGTVLTTSEIQDKDNVVSNDLRKQEYNMIVLPSQIENGDYIDVRLTLSNGLDYIVVSKKQVTIPEIDGVPSATTMNINMTEEEIMTLSEAIVESYIDSGSILYATTYVEPGMQGTATPTYVPSANVVNQISVNPNIEQQAKNALVARYQNNQTTRTLVEDAKSQYIQDKVDNIEAGVQEQITRAKEERERYLETLGGY